MQKRKKNIDAFCFGVKKLEGGRGGGGGGGGSILILLCSFSHEASGWPSG